MRVGVAVKRRGGEDEGPEGTYLSRIEDGKQHKPDLHVRQLQFQTW